MELPALASVGNELIVNKLEAIEERKSPDRAWAKVTKYTSYAERGFCTFNAAVGRGVYGIEMQKALRRQANGMQETIWGLNIRVPMTNRIASGMALMSWGSEDGKTGAEE